MILGDMWNRGITSIREWKAYIAFLYILLLAAMVGLLLMGAVVGLILGGSFGKLGLIAFGILIGIIITSILIAFRLDELAVTIAIAVHLYVDWYLGLYIVAQLMALVLLVIYYLARSPRHPWVIPRAVWLWVLFFALTLFPAIKGANNLWDAVFYYPNLIVGALIIFWLGTIIARDSTSVRRLFKMLAFFGALIALHTIIQSVTGKTLLGVASHDTFLASVSNFQLAGSETNRSGSFFIDPNWNGTFFATMVFLPLGLLIESPNFLEKTLYVAEICVMLPALLFTYSTGAWIGTFIGIIAFVIFVGRIRYRVLLSLLILTIGMVMVVYFPSEIALQIQHAQGANELSIRIAVWQTAIQVIKAFPLTGIGLGHYTYLDLADPYRVPAQTMPQDHPHNSYLEWGAMAGLPVLLVFVVLLVFAIWLVIRNWTLADARTRSLLGSGLASIVALSINSLSINGWTLPPLAAVGWLILGAISSPLLEKSLKHTIIKENTY